MDPGEDDGESALAAVGCVTAIRRVLDAVNKDLNVLRELQTVIMPIMMHALTPDGLDAIEDGLDCIALLLYYGPKGQIAEEMWRLFPQMLFIVGGKEDDVDGGFAFEYLNLVSVCIQNYIAKDPATFLSVGNGQTMSYLEQTFKFCQMILVREHASKAKIDALLVLKIILSIFENLPGQIDHAMPNIVGMLLGELQVHLQKKKQVSTFMSMLLQTIAVAFYNNAALTFQILEQNNMLVTFFTAWQQRMGEFKKEFEMRRVIFGLASLLKSQYIPEMVQAQIGQLGGTVAKMACD